MTLDKENNTIESEPISASPTKDFFVEMLTRDIELEDAILDLLDNCVDGIQRTIKNTARINATQKPYKGFWAKIDFSSQHFKLEDNCGGIPIEIAREYAFKMGRPANSLEKDSDVYTIGTYGIGMKRAIFKIGRSSSILSQTDSDCFKVSIDSKWLSSDDWMLQLEKTPECLKENGTVVEVTELRDVVKQEFSSSDSKAFVNDLVGKISHHYRYILDKGFEVWVNEKKVPVQPIRLLWDGIEKIKSHSSVIAPFLYKAKQDDIDIEIAVGLYRDIVNEEDLDNEMEGIRRSSETAGWTIVCNDRVVVYCDKTRLTGWGESKLPSYHPQFIAITGIVNLRSMNTRKLPLTTTKRGIDASSEIYLYVKEYMREGLKLFTNYTNKWKTNALAEKERVSKTQPANLSDIFEQIPKELWKPVRRRGDDKFSDERKYIPTLPMPESKSSLSKPRRINFSRPDKEVRLVAEYLFEDPEKSPSEVGDGSFDMVLREAKK